jgi:hypothetical protein
MNSTSNSLQMNFYTPATTLVTLFYMGTAFFLSAEYARKEDTIE